MTKEKNPPAHGSKEFLELVNKNESSQKISRIKNMQAKLRAVTKQHFRIAKEQRLSALALTLTLRKGENPQGKQISQFMDRLRKHFKGHVPVLPYTWVLEKGGQFHYHLTVWLPRGKKISHADLERWWPHGFTHTEMCRDPEGWTRYMRKSPTKDDLPKGMRAYGYGGMDPDAKVAVHDQCLPQWVKKMAPFLSSLRRCPGGYIDTMNGVIYQCPVMWTSKGFVAKFSEPMRAPAPLPVTA
ncbi:hypothetical protein EYS42_03235 [Aquabacterium lacunae]|uniref:Replication-associated protein ORF2/G2P domain-containing protein n=1 Tax=Aquabacterium lacunae TaxID=2528630 RepID=A0A4Q9H5Z7_9BURK|nr:hypothetical protein [Aquabacterium lacunae]TBO34440.1 hypothetical protein EYS42_03235 [Aquabacterium lacunae]